MANRHVEVEVSPALKQLYGPVRQRVRSRALIQTIEHWADISTAQQRIYAPRGETGRVHTAVHQSHPRYLPGGAGGGGTYQVSSGVVRGIAPHAEHVLFGTALSRPFFSGAGTPNADAFTVGRIYPKAARFRHLLDAEGREKFEGFELGQRMPALRIQKRGEPVRWRAWVSGQRPNNFVYTAYLDTAVYAKGQLRAIARGLLRPTAQL
jgi:hypothetical protein